MRYGPPQIWAERVECCSSYVNPKIRLSRSGLYGLIVGKGSLVSGGLRTDMALRYERCGLATLLRSPTGHILKAYTTQLELPFVAFRPWQTWTTFTEIYTCDSRFKKQKGVN